jgi:phosphoribosylamine--glycine ligase
MKAVTEERLSEIEVKFSKGSACCVIMASKGYPESYEKGFEMTIPSEIKDSVYVAGAKLEDGVLKTNGGRVLGATAKADTLKEAIKGAYELVKKIKFDNAYYRNDIGNRALKATEEN